MISKTKVCFSPLIMAVLAAVMSLPGSSANADVYTDAVIAIVGDTAITLYDVMRETYIMEQEMQAKLQGETLAQEIEELRRQTAHQLVERELIYAEFKRRGYEVPFSVIEERLDSIVLRQSGGNREAFRKRLEERQQPLAQLRQQLRKVTAVEMFVDEFVRRQVHVSPAEVARFYAENQAQFQQPAQFQLQMILLAKNGRYAGKLAATAAEIRAKAAAGTAFSELMLAYSEDAAAAAGGELGWICEDTGSSEFLAAVSDLQPGAVAAPLELDGDQVLLHLVNRQAGGKVALSGEVAAQIEAHLRSQREQQTYARLVEQLKHKTFVRIMF